MYAEKFTDSIKGELKKTDRKRNIQNKYNKENKIKPKTIIKPIRDKEVDIKDTKHIPKKDIPNLLIEIDTDMREAADKLDFERAIHLKEKMRKLSERINS